MTSKATEQPTMNAEMLQCQIATELKAPKGQYNSFGKYRYRSCEDILEAVKPLLAKYGASLVLDDEIIAVGTRFYVRATARLTTLDGMSCILTRALAREPEEKKGMDASQVTGTASSYARKYALNGLFLIDDTKDDDTRPPSDVKPAKAKPANDVPGASVIIGLVKECLGLGIKQEWLRAYFADKYGIQSLKDPTALNALTSEQRNAIVKRLQQQIRDKHTLMEGGSNEH